MGIIDDLVKEPIGGAHRNKEEVIFSVQKVLEKYLNYFKDYSRNEVYEQRKEKFLSIGKQKTLSSFSRDKVDIFTNASLVIKASELVKKYKYILILIFAIMFTIFFLVEKL